MYPHFIWLSAGPANDMQYIHYSTYVHAWANDETFWWVCIQKASQRPRSYSIFLFEWPCWWKLAWFKRSDIFTKLDRIMFKKRVLFRCVKRLNFYVKFWCQIPKSKLTKLLLALTMFSRKNQNSARNKVNHLDEKNPNGLNMILSVISDLFYFFSWKCEKTKNLSILSYMKINNQGGF